MRSCMDCDKDLTDAMGVQVFTYRDDSRGFISGNIVPTNYLLCIEHGSNGKNQRKRTSLPGKGDA